MSLSARIPKGRVARPYGPAERAATADVVLPDWLVFRPRLFPSCKPSRRIGTPTMWAATRGLAERFGMPIAASAAEGSRVNAGDPESFGSDYLDQPVELIAWTS